MIVFVYLFLFVDLSYSQSSGCMTKWYTAISDNIGTTKGMVASQVNYDEMCFSQIENYQSKVYGYITQRQCYIYSSYKYHNTSQLSISRCGQCLELTGPTQKPYICVIAGTFKVKEINNLTRSDLERTIFISNTNYNYIATNIHASYNHASQVSARVVSCNSQVNPSLHIIKTIVVTNPFPQFLSIVQPLNTDTLHKYILINSTLYSIGPDGTYTIPALKSVTVQLISINDIKINFYQIDTSKSNQNYIADSQFPLDKRDSLCLYFPESLIYGQRVTNTSLNSPVNKFFVWKFYLSPGNNDYQLINHFGTTEITVNNTQTTFFASYYPTIIQIGKTFKCALYYFISDNEDFNITLGTIQVTDFNGNADKVQSVICECDLKRESYFKENKTTVFKVGFKNRDCFSYGNLIKLDINTESNTNLKLIYAELFRRETVDIASCDVDTLHCKGMECTVNKTQNHCEPNCGNCKFGHFCSDNGKCEKIVPINSRSSSIGTTSYYCVLVVLLLFIFH